MNIEEENKKQKLFLKGLKEFNKHNFYDAHEYWEDLWSGYNLKDAKFVQALIQLSVGFFHISNSNKNGANGLLKKCLPKFEIYVPTQRGIEISPIIDAVKKSLESVNSIENMNSFDWSLVPKLMVENGR